MPTTSKKRRPPARGRQRARGRLWRWRRALLLVGLVFATAVAGALFVLFRSPLPAEPDLRQTTFLTAADGRPLARLHGTEHRVSVPLERVPEVVRRAVLATEDRKFYEHSGVDPVGIVRALWTDLRHRDVVQGGSTITQQYVKNTYVGRERSAWRKIKEAVLAVKVERQLSKDEILERYLNTIYFGRGAYGVQAAAQAWFGTDVEQLGLREAAYLAGLIRSPATADVATNPELATRRRRLALRSMRDAGFVTAAEAAAVEAEPLTAYVQPRAALAEQSRVTGEGKGTRYFVEYVRRFLVERYGEQAVYGGGLRVTTTLDLTAQTAAWDAVYGLLNRGNDPAGALVSLDGDGRVRAMVGGRQWDADVPYAKVNLAVGREGGGRGRQAGSTFKPFVLAEAVRAGYTVESALPAPAKIVLPEANNGDDWPVANYDGESFGRLNLIEATRRSVNTVYAQLVVELGPGKVASLARRLGIRTQLRPFPSIALGTEDVSVLEMADAYLTFANRGVQSDPIVVEEVRDADGDLIERFEPERRRVLDREVADVVTTALRGVVERGTGVGAQVDAPVAGKTGTTDDYGDAWFVGYTPKLTTAVWMGYPEGQSRKMTNVRGRKVSGGTFPAQIFNRFMTPMLRIAEYRGGELPEVTRFPGEVLGGVRVRSRADPPTPTTTAVDGSTTTAPEGADEGDGRDGGDDGSTATTTTRPPAPSTTREPPPTTTAPAPPTTAGGGAPPTTTGGPG